MPSNIINEIRVVLHSHISISSDRAKAFFKTGAGHYAEGDQFIGVTVPNVRKVAKIYADVPLDDLGLLIASIINEERLLALIILVTQYAKADQKDKEARYQFYLKHVRQVNNWNLVDASAHLIIGAHLWDKDRSSLLCCATIKLSGRDN